jgi:signal transduction histidine kinase
LDRHKNRIPGRWREVIRFAPSVYRGLAFAIATAQIFLFPSAHYLVIQPLVLIIGVGIYSLLITLRYSHYQERNAVTYSILGIDIAVCIFLVVSTGGLYSPFLLYTLTPVLTAALFLSRGITFAITALSGAYVIVAHIANPFFVTQLSLPELSYFFVYIVAASLAAILPYLINVNLRQHLETEDILGERQRLSREIHDGAAQTLSALRWQVQLLRRRLTAMGIELDEVKQLEKLAEKASQDTRESLELLRRYTGDGSFLPHLKGYLEQFGQEGNITFDLDTEDGNLHLEAPIELQLLRICQEALANIRKHSGADHVDVKVKSLDGHLQVSIADDGQGFDALAYYRDGVKSNGHGLTIMRERAESIGGKLIVLSLPGRGTQIQIEVPANHQQGGWIWTKR